MMISKVAMKQFMARPLLDLRKLKSWSDSRLDAALAQLDPPPKFYTKPFTHQKVAFLAAAKYSPRGILPLLEMGLGKSKVVLDLVRWWGCNAVVLVPNLVNIESWRDQVATHAPDLVCVGLDEAGREDRLAEAFDPTGDVLVLTYQGLASLLCQRIKVKGQKKHKLVPDPAKIRRFSALWDCLVCDEATACMNRSSLTTKLCTQLSLSMPYRLAMTGTPFGSDPQALWSQFYLVDHGRALGKNITLFRTCFFSQKRNYWGGFEFTFKTKLQAELSRMMAASSLHYAAADCLDLPPRVYVKVPVTMTEPIETVTQRIRNELVEAKKNSTLVENAFVNMRQAASGYATLRQGKQRELVRLGSPKEDALLEWIKSMPDTEKVVVFHDYIFTGDILAERLATEGISSTRLYSGTKDKAATLRSFTQGNKRVFLVNNQSGAMNLNLQVARYFAFYESPVSPILRQQAEGRGYRPGQTGTVFIYDFFTRGSIEEKILRHIKQGKDLLKDVLTGRAGL